jgi:hypothetical protein
MSVYLKLLSSNTSLPERFHLDGEYEVGLSEIVYPHTWFNVREEEYWIGAYNLRTNELIKTYVKSGYYCDGESFAASLTHQMTRSFVDLPEISVKFSFVRHVDRIRMQIRNSKEHIVVLSWELMEFLGFTEKVIAKKEADLVGSNAFDVNRGRKLLYVYCDVASQSVVGDDRASLLRVCNVSGKHGGVVHVTYEQPHYVPVGRRDFDAIKITINNELGDSIPFKFVTLHFRRGRR